MNQQIKPEKTKMDQQINPAIIPKMIQQIEPEIKPQSNQQMKPSTNRNATKPTINQQLETQL